MLDTTHYNRYAPRLQPLITENQPVWWAKEVKPAFLGDSSTLPTDMGVFATFHFPDSEVSVICVSGFSSEAIAKGLERSAGRRSG